MGYIDLPIIAPGTYPEVATFADLPNATTNNGKVYFVQQSTGIWLINRKSRGLYVSDGSNWLSAPEIEGYAPLVGATFTGSISATNLSGSNTGDETNATILSKIGYTPESAANKSTATTLGASDTLYPTQNAVKTYIDLLDSAFNPRKSIFGYDDFDNYNVFYNNNKFIYTSTNSGSVTYNSLGDTTAQGILENRTGTSSTGGAVVRQAALMLGSGILTFECRSKLVTIDSVNDVVTAHCGISDTGSFIAGNGCYFAYSTSSFGTTWYACTSKFSGGRQGTDLNTGVTVVADTWYRFKIVITNRTEAKFYINDNLVATNSVVTNFPASTQLLGPCFFIRQSSTSTTERKFLTDYYWFKYDLTTAR